MTRLDWPACENVRDLGGLPAAAGRIRDRTLVRSDSLTRLDDGGLAAMRAYGVGRVVDLRAEAETVDPPHPLAGTDAYVNVPWVDVSLDGGAGLVDFYLGSLGSNADRVATAVRAFADAPPGPVVVHCAVGKDRTGIVVAMLLALADVPREAIVADYVLSETMLRLEELFATLDAETRARAERFARSAPETIEAFLDRLDAAHGGAEAYLRAAGLTDAELARVRDRLVEPVAG
ncbi:MAG: tyrosine-protein phosphatase [Nocardioidaceae bacterium]|nr:tyrosine-protein phosphatase [Nocardioidaceae bacterium]NUS51108.1 tyrosine-protein phosphatase [Nocardioidaceae bacterium]